ncbi:Por secretion system C-terminal sorting domain-containing protein [Mariniphaga anaerophila]|uniref:Por secretion system C-terminal sorting domain-containing protein n=1 Tax=Mariniphaga anaerophila TaxID=1484053 RepID=A0A1M5D9T9_9BACT|nr:T9SS type A sorting domain-containing protein [Mariniphaga anaerophila]SHF63711.1 Por secretion system C-terminal sorting domain-containing protein [Mariniphaga anaerophila]
MRKSFTWFLSLMVLLTAFATHGYAQETQETVELFAEGNASYCYDEANDYTVTISVRDFINLSEFDLNLEFNDEVFEFEGATDAHASLASGISVSEAAGVVNITWSDDATTIGDNVRTDVLVLHFSVLGFPANVATSFSSNMAWGTTEFWYDIPGDQDLVNTDISVGGSLTVTVGMTGIETVVTTETCAGGDVTLSVTAPDAAYYLFNEDPNPTNWTGAWSTSPDYDVEAGDVVTVRVKDANGCISLPVSVNVPETVEPVSFTVETQNPTCYGAKGSVVFSAMGGTAPYTYYISENADGSDAVEKSNFQFNQEPGTYYVAVQDANGCANLADVDYWQEVTITDENTVITGTVTVTNVACNGDNNGEIDVEILEDGSAAVDVYQVSIDGGTTWGTAGDYTFEDLSADDYSVFVKNSNGCVVEIDTDVEITEPDAITFDMEITDTSCGGTPDGQIAVTNIVGGTAPYYVAIVESGTGIETGLGGIPTAGITFSDLNPTYYSLTITDAAGCVKEYENPNLTGNVIAVMSPDNIQFKVEVTDPLCADGDAMVEVVNITGGTGSYEILFNGVASTEDEVNTFVWAYPYDALTVTVQNTEGDACPVPQDFDADDVENPLELTASVSDVFAPTCIEGNDGNIYLNISGGTEPYYYSINGSSWKENTDGLAIIRVGVGTHTITVKDANNCEIEQEISQEVTMEENVIDAVSDSNIACFGDKEGTISVNFTSWADGLDGIDPLRGVQYFVENEAGQVSSFGPSNIVAAANVTKFNAGTYIVWVVDQYTCESNRVEVEVTENPELLIDVVYTTAASCFNTFEGTITVHATGGNVPEGTMLEYAVVNNEAALGNIADNLWLDFETYNDVDYDPALSTVSFNVDGGTYWIAVRDEDCDEKWYGPIEVEGYKELLVDEDQITTTDPLCFEGENGSITVPMSAVSGGAGSYMFTLLQWVADEWVALEDYTDQATGEFSNLPAGTYAVMVEDSEECPSYTTEDDIELVEPDELEFATEFQHMRCEGTNDGLITVTVTGGTPGYSYAINNTNSWIPFGKDALGDDLTVKTHIATEVGTFDVYIKDANGCMAGPTTVTIRQPEALGVNFLDNIDATCYGTPNGIINVEGTGGWEDYTFYGFKVDDGSWSSSTTFGGLAAGEHTLYVADFFNYDSVDTLQDLNCEYAIPFVIGSPDPITYDVVVEDVSCKDGADGSLTVTVLSGGTPFVDEDGDDDGYLVRVTGNAYDETVYTGEDFTHTFADLAHSHYTVYIEDANGCTLAPTVGDKESPYVTIESWEVQEPATYLTLDPEWVSDVTCFDGTDGKFVLIADGGTAPYKYWAGLSVEPDGHVLVPEAPAEDSEEWQESNEFNVGAGTWVTWVMDANGCIVGGEYENGVPVNKWRVKVKQPDAIEWDFLAGEGGVIFQEPTCFGESDGKIYLTNISGGSGTYNAHVWGTDAAGEDVDMTFMDIESVEGFYILAGIPASDAAGFSVTVTDDNDCISEIDEIVITQPEQVTVSLEIVDGTSCYGSVDAVIEAVANGGTGAGTYEYQLLKNGVVHTPWQAVASSFIVEVGNTFTVQVRDGNGCEASDEEYLETPEKVEFTWQNLACAGTEFAKVGFTATATEGRTLTLYYKEYEQVDTYTAYPVAFAGEDVMTLIVDDVFHFDNEELLDRHYAVYVMDSEGCVSGMDTLTIDAIQSEVAADFVLTESTECSETYTVTVSGGVGPYMLTAADTLVSGWSNGMTITLPRGQHMLKAMDSHMCAVDFNPEVVGEYVTRQVDAEAFIGGYETHFVDEEAGVDEMLTASEDPYVYTYMFGDCERTLEVTVVEVPRPLTIAEVQGTGSESEWIDEVITVTGTVTGVVEGEGFFMQDANAAWSGVWVAYANAADLAIGDGVAVAGTVGEVSSVTTISASSVEMVDAPIVVEAVEVDAPTDVENEMYESVLVKVAGGRATAANEANGEWTIYYEATDDVVVNDWLYVFVPAEGTYYNVTGIVNTRMEEFKMEPRMESDIVDLGLTPSPIVPDGAVEFSVYPNPFNERIFIDNNEKVARVVINNIAGQQVMDIEHPNREIRTANLVSGVYVISLYTEDGVRAKSVRIVKR